LISFVLLGVQPVQAADLSSSEVVLEASWGTSAGQIGLLDQPEMERCGPISFCVAGDHVLLMDSMKRRVVAVEPGKGIRALADNVQGWSICPDDAGGFFTLGDDGIAHYGETGKSKNRLSTQPPKKTIEGYGTEVLFTPQLGLRLSNVDQKNRLLATGLARTGFAATDSSPSLIGRSGLLSQDLRFYIKRLSSEDIRILGEDEDGKVLVSVQVKSDGDQFGAVLFKGEDAEGHLYVEVERLVGGKAELEVHRYSHNGVRTALLQLPNDYHTTVYKKTEVMADGSVYHFLTTAGGVRVTRYR